MFLHADEQFIMPVPFRFVVDDSQLTDVVATVHSVIPGLFLCKTLYSLFELQEGAVLRGVYLGKETFVVAEGDVVCTLLFFQALTINPVFDDFRCHHDPDVKHPRKVDVMKSSQGQDVLKTLIVSTEKSVVDTTPGAPRRKRKKNVEDGDETGTEEDECY